MSDDLVKRLRDLGDHAAFEPHMHHTAADRIEELEAKLAKAAAHLKVIRAYSDAMARPLVVKALAELKGETDA